jgi:hypothetical protein
MTQRWAAHHAWVVRTDGGNERMSAAHVQARLAGCAEDPWIVGLWAAKKIRTAPTQATDEGCCNLLEYLLVWTGLRRVWSLAACF